MSCGEISNEFDLKSYECGGDTSVGFSIKKVLDEDGNAVSKELLNVFALKDETLWQSAEDSATENGCVVFKEGTDKILVTHRRKSLGKLIEISDPETVALEAIDPPEVTSICPELFIDSDKNLVIAWDQVNLFDDELNNIRSYDVKFEVDDDQYFNRKNLSIDDVLSLEITDLEMNLNDKKIYTLSIQESSTLLLSSHLSQECRYTVEYNYEWLIPIFIILL